MITIFKDKKDIPSDKEYVELNDVFFNQKTVSRIDDKASAIIEKIDASNIDEIVEKEIGLVFMDVLEDAGVYKRTVEGQKAFDRFVECLGE